MRNTVLWRSRKLLVGAITLGSAVAMLSMAALPAAATECTVVVTLITEQKLYFHLPPGVPTSTLRLPSGVVSIKETCPTSTKTPATPPPPNTTLKPPATTSTSRPKKLPRKSHGVGQSKLPPSSHHGGGSNAGSSSHGSGGSHPSRSHPSASHRSGSSPGSKPSSHHTSPPPQPRSSEGVPTPTDRPFSFDLPNPPPMGVPNFFIDSFRIPPFLLPIYQAAGIQYDVPWQVLAAVNEIETDYGRNLSVSSAGAVGWMQFLPSTWKTWGVDANGDGAADPYNPVDAIFAAARYLHAAGASQNLSQAIFAYNHASWYVQSVLLRAKLIGGMPDQLIGALTGLVSGHFPVAAPSKYADGNVKALSARRVATGNAAVPVDSNPNATGVSIFAKKNSPAIAVNDGKIVKIGTSDTLGRYVKLQDSTGNVYTYAHLGSVPQKYPVPKPVRLTAADLAKELAAPKKATPKPLTPASAGTQSAGPTPSTSQATSESKSGPPSLPVTPAPATKPQTEPQQTLVKERLFAYPSRPASYAAGGSLQLKNAAGEISSFRNYFSDVLHLARNQYTLEPLKAGSIVVAGTILGRVATPTATTASHMIFMIQPAGKNAPQIDPKPILDGWKLLEATASTAPPVISPFARERIRRSARSCSCPSHSCRSGSWPTRACRSTPAGAVNIATGAGRSSRPRRHRVPLGFRP